MLSFNSITVACSATTTDLDYLWWLSVWTQPSLWEFLMSAVFKCVSVTLYCFCHSLVILLLILRLTLAVGTTNGLTFYANIVAVNRALFFPSDETNILTVFIAWMNLDLGIETCFFDGMDAYAKTWLQFVFPAYVCNLVGAVITLVHYFTTVARLFGSNPISVLATLFLLSYTKLLRTIITTFSLTILEYPNELELVWIFDGNIQLSHHFFISLFLTAVLAQVLFISYTLLLLMGPWIQTHSKRRVFSWINNYMY